MPLSKPPYFPSWLDRLVTRIDGLNLSSFRFYLLLTGSIWFLFVLLLWISGAINFGSFHYISITTALYTVIPLALYQYLSAVAGMSLENFRPVLQVDTVESDKLKYGLQNLSSKWGWLLLAIGLVFGVMDVSTRPSAYLINPTSPFYFTITSILMTSFNGAIIFSLIAQTIHQLSLVTKIHRLPLKINLFQLDAPHAFSKLTARAAIGLIVIGLLMTTEPSQSSLLIGLYVVLAGLALVAFFAPLAGMYRTIKSKKGIDLSRIDLNIEIMIEKIQAQVDADKFRDAGGLNTTLSGLVSSKSIVQKIPAWPWDVSLFRGFITSIFLPILLWLIFRLLDRLV